MNQTVYGIIIIYYIINKINQKMNLNKGWSIREIKKEDNNKIRNILQLVMTEFKVPSKGTALSDPEIFDMYSAYMDHRSIYYVLEKNNKIYGGAGLSKLKNSNQNICELQKMYFMKDARGLGLGNEMIIKCLNKAIDFGFKSCYIETMYNMIDAQKLYLSHGFIYIDNPIGNTGHSSCPVWMLKKLYDIN